MQPEISLVLSASYLIKFHFFERRRDYITETDSERQKHLC